MSLRWFAAFFILFALGLVVSETARAGEALTIVTYNAGLLKKAGVDFVPCVGPRTNAQAREVFRVIDSRRTPFFVAGLQEVWTREGYEAYAKLAHRRGYTYSPKSYDEIKDNGEMIVTNAAVVKERFLPFAHDSHVHRGLRIVEIQTQDSHRVEYVNLHTSYSDSRSYSKTHLSQLVDLAHFLDREHKIFDGEVIVAGDFNAGPNISYINQRYDAAKVLWQDWLAPMFRDREFTEALYDGDTWDVGNPLVSNAAAVIKIANLAQYGVAGWEEKTAKLDHIFASNAVRVLDSHIVLNEPIKLAHICPDRSDAEGRTPLSDHYALESELAL